MNSIGSFELNHLQLPNSARLKGAGTSEARPESFVDLLSDGVMEVNGMQQTADTGIHELLTGGDVNQVEVFAAVQKADMAFRLLVQIRNKLLTAYDEINAIRV